MYIIPAFFMFAIVMRFQKGIEASVVGLGFLYAETQTYDLLGFFGIVFIYLVYLFIDATRAASR